MNKKYILSIIAIFCILSSSLAQGNKYMINSKKSLTTKFMSKPMNP